MRYYFTSDFEGILIRFPLAFPGEYWPHGLFIKQGQNLVWINEYPEIRRCGKSVFVKYMLGEDNREKLKARWMKMLAALNSWERKVDKANLSRLDLTEFIELWSEMREHLLNFWTDFLIPELGNYGADEMLEKELRKIIKSESEIKAAMEVLTAPEAPSFYQQEEIDLYKTKDLEEHAKKYFWLKNSYSGAEALEVKFFKDRKGLLKFDIETAFKKRRAMIRRKKLEIQKKYKLPTEVVSIAQAFVKGVEWQDLRKKFILIYIYYKDLMILEASARLNILKDDLLNFGTGEILKMLKGKKVSQTIIGDRRIAFAVVMDVLEEPIVTDSKTALKYWDLYIDEKIDGEVKKLEGIIVSRAQRPVQGRVHILLNPKKFNSFKNGEILVAPMTTPDYIFAMKKAAAVITDTGGLMSHAAIVSRELEIPCIVGTKIATKVLKDGDLVEVDANMGIIKILRK